MVRFLSALDPRESSRRLPSFIYVDINMCVNVSDARSCQHSDGRASPVAAPPSKLNAGLRCRNGIGCGPYRRPFLPGRWAASRHSPSLFAGAPANGRACRFFCLPCLHLRSELAEVFTENSRDIEQRNDITAHADETLPLRCIRRPSRGCGGPPGRGHRPCRSQARQGRGPSRSCLMTIEAEMSGPGTGPKCQPG